MSCVVRVLGGEVPDVSVREARVFDKTIFEDAPSTSKSGELATTQLVFAARDSKKDKCLGVLTGRLPTPSEWHRHACHSYLDSMISGRYLTRSELPVHPPCALLYILAQLTLAYSGLANDVALEGFHRLGDSTEAIAVISPRTGVYCSWISCSASRTFWF
jgi:hypothetical protein